MRALLAPSITNVVSEDRHLAIHCGILPKNHNSSL